MDGNGRPQGFTEPPEENNTLKSFDGAEEISESFRCCVCLELLCKPVVLVCGHVSCFWCVHTAMSGARESHCPICRNPFLHFPSVCELLHFLLLKIHPVVYKRRESQAREEETQTGFYSPEISDRPANESVNNWGTLYKDGLTTCEEHHWKNNEDGREVLPIENSLQENGLGEGTLKHISVTDVLCKSCKKLLVLPVVLNCGHVYCRSCLAVSVDGSLNCQDCQSSHPGKFPKVCLVLDHFLEEQFPKAYSIRREEIQGSVIFRMEVHHYDNRYEDAVWQAHLGPEYIVTINCDLTGSGTSSNEKECGKSQPSKNGFASLQERGLEVNVGVGCDSCGMYPIIGKWYRCKDCTEKIGFDLCESCYDTRSKLPGRFNQQHTPDHRLILVQPERLRGIVWRLAIEDGAIIPVFTDDEHHESQDTDSAV